MQKTYMHKKEQVVREWHLYDLSGKVLGRASTEIARLLMGKHKLSFTPHVDAGDFVVAINASKSVFTGKKLTGKKYRRHSGYPGGFKEETLATKMEQDPAFVIKHSVRGMLPKNTHQEPRLRRLKVYPDSTHPHANHFTEKKDK